MMAKKEKPDFNKLMSRANGGGINPFMITDEILGNVEDVHTLVEDDTRDNQDDILGNNIKNDSVGNVKESNESVVNKRKSHRELNNNNGFKPYVDLVNTNVKTESDKNIEKQITTIVLAAINNVQIDCEEDEKGNIIQAKHFDEKDNSVLLRNTFYEVANLIDKLIKTDDEKHSYFNTVITDFISNRLSFIKITCLDMYYSPAYVEKTMKDFLQIEEECIPTDVLDMYFDVYFKSCLNMIHSRITRTTVYMNEVLSEALDIKKRTEGFDMSLLVNKLLLDNIEEKYIEQAKDNLYNRRPTHEHYPKRLKSELIREKRKLKLI